MAKANKLKDMNVDFSVNTATTIISMVIHDGSGTSVYQMCKLCLWFCFLRLLLLSSDCSTLSFNTLL